MSSQLPETQRVYNDPISWNWTVIEQPQPIPPSVEAPVLNETRTKIDKFKEDSVNILPRTTEWLSIAFQKYNSIDIPETPVDKQKFVYFIMEYFIYANWFSVIEKNWKINVVSTDSSEYTKIATQKYTELLNNNWIDNNDIQIYLDNNWNYNDQLNSKSSNINPQNQQSQQQWQKKTPLTLDSQTMADAVRNPFWFVNKTLWSMNWISSLSLIIVSIRAIFWKPFEWKFWKFLALVWWYWVAQALWITEDIAKGIEWSQDSNTSKVINWSKKMLWKSIDWISDISNWLITNISYWYYYSNFNFWEWSNKKPIVESNFLDIYDASKNNWFTASNLTRSDNNPIVDIEIIWLNKKISDLFSRWSNVFGSDENFKKEISWKNIIQVEKIVYDKESENIWVPAVAPAVAPAVVPAVAPAVAPAVTPAVAPAKYTEYKNITKEQLITKIESTKKEFFDKIDILKNSNSQQKTELKIELNTQINKLINKVNQSDDLIKLNLDLENFKLMFDSKLVKWFSFSLKWFILDYFNKENIEMNQTDLLKIVKIGNLEWDDFTDNERLVNEVFRKIESIISEKIKTLKWKSDIDIKAYKKYLFFELSEQLYNFQFNWGTNKILLTEVAWTDDRVWLSLLNFDEWKWSLTPIPKSE